MEINKNLFKKDKASEEVDEVNKIMDSIRETNKTIDYVADTLVLSGNEIIDKKNFSIMSLPSTEEVLRDL